MKRSRLQADPEKVRAFVQRGRENARERERAQGREGMKSTALRAMVPDPGDEPRGQPPRKPKRKQVSVPATARRNALARSHGICVVCLHREGIDLAATPVGHLRVLVGRGVLGLADTVHHVFLQQKWPALIKAEDNLIGACWTCHASHHAFGCKRTRIPLAALPECAVALAEGDGRMQAYLERTYA